MLVSGVFRAAARAGSTELRSAVKGLPGCEAIRARSPAASRAYPARSASESRAGLPPSSLSSVVGSSGWTRNLTPGKLVSRLGRVRSRLRGP